MEYKRLGDIIQHKKGYAFQSALYEESGKMVVRVTDFTLDSVSTDDAVYIQPCPKYEPFLLKEGDILIQTVGSWANNPNSIVGKVVRVPVDCEGAYLNQNIVKIAPKDTSLDNTYLFYALKANMFSQYCVLRGQGAANQASITLNTIFKFKFNVHALDVQRKISSILSTYDTLMANNTKRVRLLEKMAENLYKEWFVRFRFPGYEKYSFHNGIPVESTITQIKYCVTRRNIVLKTWDNLELIDLSRMKPFSISISDIGNASELTSNVKKVCKFDIVFGSIRSYQGKCGFSPIDGAIAGSVYNFYPIDPNMYSYLLMLVTSRPFINYTTNYSNGTKMPVLNYKDLVRFKFVAINDKSIYKRFNDIVFPIIKEIDKLNSQNSSLARQRDLLLPRLMSGKIEV